jgi:hypothetical protein
MAGANKRSTKNSVDTKKQVEPKQPRARTEEGREQQLIKLANDLAERRMLDGTASSQTINNYIREGSVRRRLENEKLRMEIEMIKAKTKSLESSAHLEELFASAIKAMSIYQGVNSPREFDDGGEV